MHDPSHPVFETTHTGCQVAGTGFPRLQAAARAGEAVSRGKSRWGFMRWRRNGGSARRADLYSREEGPGRISRLSRLRMDLWDYGSGKTKDAYGTEADVRAISGSDQSWAGFKLRVLTQNLWALPVISRCLEARVHAFAKTLGSGWDVVALQEVWHARERDALRRAALSVGLRYSRHFEKGCGAPLLGAGSGGTGMMVLSRFPIVESFFWRFSANGQPYQLNHADYLGGKGVGLARLHTPAGAVDLYVSHLHADYDRARGSGSADRYKAHRVAQAFELAHIIRLTSKSPLVLLLSDLNSGPGSMPYGLQRTVAGLGDAFAQAKPRQAGHTCEASDNVFSNRRDPPARLDYVLFKAVPPPLCAPQAIEPTWELRDCWVHTAHVPEQDAEGLLPPPTGAIAPSPYSSASTASSPATSLTASPSRPTTDGGAVSRPSPSVDGLGGNPFGGVVLSPARSRSGHFIDGVGGGGVRRAARRGQGAAAARRVNLSDHHGVAAEFVARDLEGDGGFDNIEDSGREMSPILSLPLAQTSIGGSCPQGPLLARALTEIDRGIEGATARRISHLRCAKAVVVLWVGILAGSTVAAPGGPMGLVARAAAGTLGGFLCAVASVLFLAYWFSAKEELQGLKEVFQTATNYERHLPMEEAFQDGGFDTSQFNTYMEHHFR